MTQTERSILAIIWILFGGVLCLSGASVAHAGAFNMGMLTNTLSTDHVTQQEAARAVSQEVFNPSALIAQDGEAVNRARSIDARYAYSKERTQRNLRNFVQRTTDPSARSSLEQMLAAQPNLIEDIGEAIRPYGLDPHDAVDAYSLWWINSWLVANKRDEDPDQGTVAMVRQQARNAFAATPDFGQTSDAQRQEWAEAHLLQAAILSSAFEQWKNDPAMLDQLAQAVRQGAKASGLDLSLMTLTENGFVPRQGVDASGSAPRMERDGSPADPRLAASEGASSTTGPVDVGTVVLAAIGVGTLVLGGVALRRQG